MGPFVLILSYGSTKPIQIVQNLLAAKNSSSDLSAPIDIKIEETTFPTYKYCIKNKYFETIVKLIPFEESINSIPLEILKETEAVIVAFDSTDKSFLKQIPNLCDLITKNNIELGLLLTSEIKDDCNESLSYTDIKEACQTNFDIIETLSKDEEEEDTTVDTIIHQNYSEVTEALENHVWSNVASPNSNNIEEKKEEEEEIDDLDEQQMEVFEHLLTRFTNFEISSANLNHNQRLDEAEKLIEMFSNFMADD